ncbi:CNPV161 TGF-beta-like protein [Canarypox virus]|uniref:CNPV161 TGF-beta-like protein n=1 Tax=Canarypox virus TaxID=44088 RepID=Q6VZI6_CNPV|nr:CNPV161 TGF-beta-like protein [Canarypox virus]AAR83507.1 CNPV161 TGF-beta-like protein [Canarypox virus]AWD84637.1 TGF-beta-like protein [Canarypox virus]
MKLFYAILFSYFVYTHEYNSLSDILLEQLNLTIEDVTNHLNDKIIVSPHGYEKSPTITVSGQINGGVVTFPDAYEYLETYDVVASSMCIYYHSLGGERVTISITQYNDGIYLLSVNETIIPKDTWTCIKIPERMIENLYSFDNHHLSVGFKVRPSIYVDTSKEPLLELYLKSDQFNTISYSINNKCDELCDYKLEDVNVDLLTMLGIHEGRHYSFQGKHNRRYKRQFFYSVSSDWLNRNHNHNHNHNRNPITAPESSISYYDICSLRYQYITFEDMGCNWVLSPKGIMFSYCTGTCVVSSFDKSSVIYGKMLLNSIHKTKLHVCCKPIRRQSVKITYMHGKNIKQSEIKNFMPSECGC